MREFVARRLLLLAPILLGITLLTFFAFRLIPGDAPDRRCGFDAPPDCVEGLRHKYGLDRPWYVQYGDWLAGVLQGDLGTSMNEGELAVGPQLRHRLPITFELMVMSLVLALLLGIPPGVLSAARPGTVLDWLARFLGIVGLSVPSYYLGVLVITFGYLWFGWSPPQFGEAYVPIWQDPWVNLQQFFAPSLVLALGISAVVMRLTRSSLLDVLRQDYIRTAWSKGLRERTVVTRHALKNAFIPVVTIIGLQVGAIMSGTVIVEFVFALNGMGYYLYDSVLARDFLVVQSLLLVIATVYVLSSLVVDVAYGWLDPRVRYA